MPLLGFLTPLLQAFGGWLLKRLSFILIGGGLAAIGWETGIIQIALKALLLALFDLLLYIVDNVAGFLIWVLDEQNWEVPDAYEVMGGLPDFTLAALDAIGFWNGLGLFFAIFIFKFAARIIGLRMIFK